MVEKIRVKKYKRKTTTHSLHCYICNEECKDFKELWIHKHKSKHYDAKHFKEKTRVKVRKYKRLHTVICEICGAIVDNTKIGRHMRAHDTEPDIIEYD